MTINFNDVTTFMYGQNEVHSFVINNTTVWTKPVAGPYVEAVFTSGQILNPVADYSNISKIYLNNVELDSSQWVSSGIQLVYHDNVEISPGQGYGQNGIFFCTPEESSDNLMLYFVNDDTGDEYYGTVSWDGSSWYFDESDTSISPNDTFNIGYGALLECVVDSRFGTDPVIRITFSDDTCMDDCLEAYGSCWVYSDTPTAYSVSGNTTVKYVLNTSMINNLQFYNCSGMTSVSIHGVTIIAQQAFDFCMSLISVQTDNILTTINRNAFNWCSSLSTVILGSSLSNMDTNVFYWCKNISSITCLATTAPTINQYTFQGLNNNGTLIVPANSSGYDVWMQNANYYLGKYGWTMQTV